MVIQNQSACKTSGQTWKTQKHLFVVAIMVIGAAVSMLVACMPSPYKDSWKGVSAEELAQMSTEPLTKQDWHAIDRELYSWATTTTDDELARRVAVASFSSSEIVLGCLGAFVGSEVLNTDRVGEQRIRALYNYYPDNVALWLKQYLAADIGQRSSIRSSLGK